MDSGWSGRKLHCSVSWLGSWATQAFKPIIDLCVINEAHSKITRRREGPFSYLLITHSYLCSVLFTRSLKQVLMRTKGIRQAEGESPYTVKTKGAIWWKEEASNPLTLTSAAGPWANSLVMAAHSNNFSLGGRAQIRLDYFFSSSEWHERYRNDAGPSSFHLQQQSAKTTGPFCFFKRLVRSENRSLISVEGPRRAL